MSKCKQKADPILTRILIIVALLSGSLCPLQAYAAKHWISHCKLAEETDSTTKKLKEDSLFTVFVCAIVAETVTSGDQTAAIQVEGEQRQLVVTHLSPEQNEIVVALANLANPANHLFAEMDNILDEQPDEYVIMDAVTNFQQVQLATRERLMAQAPDLPALNAVATERVGCHAPHYPLDKVYYPFSGRDIDDEIIENMESLLKKSKRRNIPPQITPQLRHYFPKLQNLANQVPIMVKWWDSFKSYFFYMTPFITAL